MIGIIETVKVLAMLSPDVDPDEGTDVGDVLPRKRRSEHYRALLQDVLAHGITVPVVIDFTGPYPELLEGHHRIAAAVDAGLKMVPWSSVPLRIDA